VIDKKSLPKEVIDLWPEIFGEIKLNVLPFVYVHSIKITFKNNKIWEIDFKKNLKEADWNRLEKEMESMIQQYENDISEIDFKLDTDQIKKDAISHTKKFLKNKKLK
jgi:hypothetical protein